MSSNLLEHFVTQIDTVVRNEYQYEGQFSYDMFYTKMGKAKTFDFNKQGIVYSHKHISNAPLVLDSMAKSKEKIDVEFYDVNYMVDSVEELLINYSEKQEAMQACKMAAGRRKDAVLLEAMYNTSFLADRIVPKNVSGANAGLTVQSIKAAAAIMDANNIPQQDRFLVVHPNQIHNSLTNDIKVTSKDFTKAEALDSGTITQFYGFNLIKVANFEVVEGISAGIPIDTVNSTTYAYAFVGKGMKCPIGCAVNTDITFRVGEVAERGFAALIHGKVGLGAKTIDNKGVIRIDCAVV